MTTADTRVCKQCERRVEISATHIAPRMSGGNYRRAARAYHMTICNECLLRLAASRTPGSALVERWGASYLQLIAWQIMTPARR